MSRRIALRGLSGVGKSTLIARLKESMPVLHLQASALIKAEQARRAQQPTSSEALRTGPVLDNQALLIAAFRREAAAADIPIVFDGHSIVDGRDGLVEISSNVFAALELDAVCFLWADPKLIAQRRLADKERERPRRDAQTLTAHQSLARDAAERIATDIQRPFLIVEDSGLDLLVELLA
jgi:adenylate kinase